MFGRGHGRRARRGDVRGAILLVLADAPRNGYQIMQELAQRSGGAWRPSSGSVYPTLQQLEDEGLVEAKAAAGEGGRVYALTERGKRYVGKNRDDMTTAFESAHGSEARGADPRAETGALLRDLGVVLFHVLSSGTPEQVAATKRRLAELRRELYAMLARDPDADDGDDEDDDADGDDDPASADE
jgi:DNA-binding PadR family transcriptional regulator|nr:PadR family transcriptional regulator [Kofleriaceae bacterium]